MPMYRKSLIALAIIIGVISVFMLFGSTKEENLSLDDTAKELTTENNGAAGKENNEEVKTKGPTVAVYITGEVAKPGVVLLSSNSRLAEAVEACGNFTAKADVDKVNLSLPVEDGMEVAVPAKDIGSNGQGTTNSAVNTEANGNLININTANEDEFKKLPGIGPGTAKKIMEYRSQKGNFNKIEDIRQVKGIGKGKYEKIQDKIRV